jgi:hypothetical protein
LDPHRVRRGPHGIALGISAELHWVVQIPLPQLLSLPNDANALPHLRVGVDPEDQT